MDRFVASLLILSGLIDPGFAVRCYECTSELVSGEYDACLYGDERFLRQRTCREPSVCITYQYNTEIPFGVKTSINRGCQGIRYGSTCEDIFDGLRKTGSVLPGQHTCTTCSEDLCNSAARIAPSVAAAAILVVSILW